MTTEEIIDEARRLDPDGVLSAADVAGYFEVIFAAFEVHVERERIRKGLWKEYGPGDQLHNVRTKADRIRRSLEQMGDKPYDDEAGLRDNVIEEGYDIINYDVFMVRQVKGEVA